MSESRRSIDTANSRLDRTIGWVDRALPFGRYRPLDRLPSIKLKVSIVIGAAIATTIITLIVGYWLGVSVALSVAIAIFVSIVLVQILARGLTAPVTEMMRAVDDMSNGNYAQRVDATAADELGELGRSFNVMAAHISEQPGR